MKRIAGVLLCLCFVLFAGCGKSPLAPPGILSMYSGHSQTANSAPELKRVVFEGNASAATLYIQKVEISREGAKWIDVLTQPVAVNMTTENVPTRIGDALNLPDGQYDGVRITLLPKVHFILPDGITSKNFEQPPHYLGIGQPFNQLIAQNPSTIVVTLSSLNGYFTPFRVEKDVETFLIFDLEPTIFNNDGWDLYIAARATRFLD